MPQYCQVQVRNTREQRCEGCVWSSLPTWVRLSAAVAGVIGAFIRRVSHGARLGTAPGSRAALRYGASDTSLSPDTHTTSTASRFRRYSRSDLQTEGASSCCLVYSVSNVLSPRHQWSNNTQVSSSKTAAPLVPRGILVQDENCAIAKIHLVEQRTLSAFVSACRGPARVEQTAFVSGANSASLQQLRYIRLRRDELLRVGLPQCARGGRPSLPRSRLIGRANPRHLSYLSANQSLLSNLARSWGRAQPRMAAGTEGIALYSVPRSFIADCLVHCIVSPRHILGSIFRRSCHLLRGYCRGENLCQASRKQRSIDCEL